MSIQIGILGGAFDPPHLGHRRCIDWALGSGVRMDKVFVIPSGVRVDKPGQTDYAHRLAMCVRAFGDLPKVLVGAWESPQQRQGPCYMYDTVVLLKKLYPWWGFHLIVGSDYTEGDLLQWYRGEELVKQLAGVIRVPRSQESSTQLRQQFDASWTHPQVADYVNTHGLYGVSQ